MDPLILLIEPDLDERAAAATMSRAQRVYEDGARDISRVMRNQLNEGTQAAGKGFEELETKARRAYLGMQDAGEKVAAAERKHEAAQERGAANAEALGRRVERARLDEIQAIERASTAYREYETAARSAGQAGEQAGDAATRGMNGAAAGALAAGREAAGGFVSGFTAAGPAARLAGLSVIPGVGWIAAAAAVGLAAGKVLVDNISAGMATMATRDLFQTRLGVDEATMSRYGAAAGGAFTNSWGASVEDNLRAVQFAVQGGVIDRGASNAEIEQTIGQMQALAGVMEVDVQEAARASGQLIRGDFANSGTEAANIIVSGFQRGLDISGDWLDTVTEYTTQFRKLGLDGDDALGLIQQGLQGAARDSDVVADSLKEFSLRSIAADNKDVREGFDALGFNADEMFRNFATGGETARASFGAVLDAIRSVEDPVQQGLIWTRLFGTQFEDMGEAINKMDLSTARTEFGSTEGAIDEATRNLSKHVDQWEVLGRTWDTQFAKLKEWLADSDIGRFFGNTIPSTITDFINPQGPGIGSGGYTNPSIPSAPMNPLDMLVPGAPGAPRSAGDLLMPSLTGPPAPGAAPPAGPAPVPGDRTPIPTDAAGGGTSLPTAPSLPLQYTSTAGLPTQVANAQTRLDEAAHAAAEKQARVNQLKQSNIATEEDIQKASNDLTKAEMDRQQAEQALHDARIGASEKQAKQLASTSSELSEFGAQLDKDFGISKGLGGIMENVTRFLGNLIAAPFLKALGMVADANPNEGSGMTGILAANGAFGSQFTPGAISASSMGPAAWQPGAGMPGGSAPYGSPGAAQPGQSARGFAHETMMPFWKGLGLTVGDHQADSHGEHQNGALDIMVDSIAEGNAVLQQVLQDPNVYGAIFNNKSYGYGQGAAPRDYSGGNTGNPTQDHQDHVHAWYKPGGSNNIAAGGGGGGGFSIPSVAPTYAPTPGAAGAGPGWFPPGAGLPATGGGGESPIFGASPTPASPGLGGALGIPAPAAPGMGAAAGLGGQPYPAGPGGGGLGMSGGLMDAAMMGAGAADLMMPGAGAAAKIGIQVANRTIKYAGQMAGIGVSGLMQTLTPAGDNPKASIGNSWFGKIAGGLASAAPALPNQAGGKPPGALAGQQGGQQGQGGAGGNTQNVTLNQTNNRVSEETATSSGVREMAAANFNMPGKQ